jgi:hypothetical protein
MQSKGKTLDEISIQNFSTGEQLTHREKLRTMKELVVRYSDKYVMIRNSGRMPAQWFRYPEEDEKVNFDIERAQETINVIHPSTERFTYFEDFNDSDDRQRTARWLEVFNHYLIKPNPNFKPVSERGLADTVERLKELHLAFKDILERVRKEG